MFLLNASRFVGFPTIVCPPIELLQQLNHLFREALVNDVRKFLSQRGAYAGSNRPVRGPVRPAEHADRSVGCWLLDANSLLTAFQGH
jgi:hypothetical protein